MSVLKSYFNKNLDQRSPVQPEIVRVVNYDEDGNEFITYEEFDLRKHQESLGSMNMWSLDSLLKAGINPDFPIHTGNNTRLDGIDVIKRAEVIADEILAESKNNEVKD